VLNKRLAKNEINSMNHSRTYLFTGVILAAVMFAMSQFYRSSVAVISPDLMQEMGLNALDLSRISAAFFYAFALMQIPVGIFLDTVGPKTAMVGLTLVSVAGAVVFALGTTPGWLTFGRVLLGIGMACNFMGALKLLTLWFEPRQFATLSALVVSLGTLGNIAAATPLVLLVGWVGWRHSFLVIAGFTLALVLVFLAVIKDRPGPASRKDDHMAGQRRDLSGSKKRAAKNVSGFCVTTATGPPAPAGQPGALPAPPCRMTEPRLKQVRQMTGPVYPRPWARHGTCSTAETTG
jgi:MFS family permease